MRTFNTALLVASIALLNAQPKPPVKPLQIPIQQYKLDNGLRIVLSEDHSAPTYGISITYNVGSHNEHAGPHRLCAPVRTHDVPGICKMSARAST